MHRFWVLFHAAYGEPRVTPLGSEPHPVQGDPIKGQAPVGPWGLWRLSSVGCSKGGKGGRSVPGTVARRTKLDGWNAWAGHSSLGLDKLASGLLDEAQAAGVIRRAPSVVDMAFGSRIRKIKKVCRAGCGLEGFGPYSMGMPANAGSRRQEPAWCGRLIVCGPAPGRLAGEPRGGSCSFAIRSSVACHRPRHFPGGQADRLLLQWRPECCGRRPRRTAIPSGA